LPEKEHSWTVKNPKLFPSNQQQMEHSNLLIIPENRLSGNRINGPEDEKLICESLSDFGIIGFVPKQEEIVKAGRAGRKVCEDIDKARERVLMDMADRKALGLE
jgi:hypothetical protein